MKKTLLLITIIASLGIGNIAHAATDWDYNFPQYSTASGTYVDQNLTVSANSTAQFFVSANSSFGHVQVQSRTLGSGLIDNGSSIRVALPFANATTSVPGLMTQTQASQLDVATVNAGKAYDGTTLRSGSFPVFKSGTVSSGVVAFNLTDDGTSGGVAICTNGVIQDSINVQFNDSATTFQTSYSFSNSNKTLTITANKASFLLGLIQGQTAANGSVVRAQIWCY